MNERNNMLIRFNYDGKPRRGELVRFYNASNGQLIAKVLEEGGDYPKSFRIDKMTNIESGPAPLTDEEMLPLLREAADSLYQITGHKFDDGNKLQLLLSLAYNDQALTDKTLVEKTKEATECFSRRAKNGGTW